MAGCRLFVFESQLDTLGLPELFFSGFPFVSDHSRLPNSQSSQLSSVRRAVFSTEISEIRLMNYLAKRIDTWEIREAKGCVEVSLQKVYKQPVIHSPPSLQSK